MTTHVRRQVTGALLGLLVGGLVLLVLVLLVRTWSLADDIRSAQKTNTGTLNNTSRTLDLVESCTTPKRECYERGQEQTAGAIADINQVTILAAACADKPQQQSRDEIYACVVRRLAATSGRPPMP